VLALFWHGWAGAVLRRLCCCWLKPWHACLHDDHWLRLPRKLVQQVRHATGSSIWLEGGLLQGAVGTVNRHAAVGVLFCGGLMGELPAQQALQCRHASTHLTVLCALYLQGCRTITRSCTGSSGAWCNVSRNMCLHFCSAWHGSMREHHKRCTCEAARVLAAVHIHSVYSASSPGRKP
jgi:hypothetical protein